MVRTGSLGMQWFITLLVKPTVLPEKTNHEMWL